MEPKFMIIGCLVLLVLILLINARSNYELYDDMLGGMWVSDPEWAEKADLDGMLLFVGPNEGWFSDTRKCYLIMHADNHVIVNKQIEMCISSGVTLVPSKELTCSVQVTDLDGKDKDDELGISDEYDVIPFEEIMPKNMTLVIGISSGKLVLKGDDKGEEVQYAKLYKDAVATEIGRNREDNDVEECDDEEDF